jgi:hypothetical protein
MHMNSGWLHKPWPVRGVLYLFAVGVVLGLPLAAPAQTKVEVVSIAGGSSALLGEFTPETFHQGPIPQAMEDSLFKIHGYRPAGVPDDGVLVVSNVVVRDPRTPNPPGAPLETASYAMVRWYRRDATHIKVIIFLLSDSGRGVRYVANVARITDFPRTGPTMSIWRQRTAINPPRFGSPTGDGALVMQALLNKLDPGRTYYGSKLKIGTGYSDVTADTVVRYGNVPNLNVAGLQGIVTAPTYGPVQTLLLLYNKNMVYAITPYQIIFPRVTSSSPPELGVQTVLNAAGTGATWDEFSPLLLHFEICQCRLGVTSGTRLTEYTNIQRILPGGTFVPDNIDSTCEDTASMLESTEGLRAAFGYAFVGGVLGGYRGNVIERSDIRVGRYKDSLGNVSAPYPITDGAGPDCALPGQFNQAPYSDDPNLLYQTGVVDGSYPLWSYANMFSRPETHFAAGAKAQAEIFNALLAPSDPDVVHLEGLLRPSELLVERNYFISSITGEYVTDGQRVVPLGTAVPVPEPPNDDPQP